MNRFNDALLSKLMPLETTSYLHSLTQTHTHTHRRRMKANANIILQKMGKA